MGNNYTSGMSGNHRDLATRREARMSNSTGPLPAASTAARSYPGSFDFENMLVSLRELFALDRQKASQSDSSRCGICYLHFLFSELHYRDEEGFYVCYNCERALGKQTVPMLRRQQK